MSDTVARDCSGRRRIVGGAVFLILSLLLLGASATEEGLLRQLKVDLFDQDWPAVLRGCEAILERFPHGETAPQAAFYKAQALSRLPGGEGEALSAYRRFITSYPDQGVLVEEAWSAAFRLACERRGGEARRCIGLLREGIESRSAYISTLAAIRAADESDASLRREALQELKGAYERETNSEIRNEILIAILKIDPQEVPPPEPMRPTGESRRSGGKEQPTLIRMTVYNKVEERYELRVNLPVAFARMLLEALGTERRAELGEKAHASGIDLEDIFETISRSGAGKLLEADIEDSRIVIWIE
jgi:hypothetical protein